MVYTETQLHNKNSLRKLDAVGQYGSGIYET